MLRHLREIINQSPEIKDRWRKLITEARSGRYEQIYYRLSTEEGCFCFEGLMAEVSGLGQWEKGIYGNQQVQGREYVILPNESKSHCLSLSVWNYYGSEDDNRFKIDDQSQTLITDFVQMNDGKKLTFSQIADIIERHIEG